ncbi:OmpA family protein [bacterium]|nr:OmpA family protein [bacterium]
MRKIYCVLFCLIVASCHPTPGPDKSVAGAILGASWGAGAGAVVGHQVGATGPGAAIGAGFGAADGLITGAGLDLAESTDLDQQAELDEMRIRVLENQRQLQNLQDSLDGRVKGAGIPQYSARVFFDDKSAALRSGSADDLQKFADLYKRNPRARKIQVVGHSDNASTVDENDKIAEARARSVAAFLAAQGVALDRIFVESQGARRPLASNEADVGRQLNRRVDVFVIN